MKIRRPLLAGLGLAAAAVALTATPASAHVTARLVSPPHHGFASFVVRVPNESDTAGTTKVELHVADEPPISSASVQPVPGWTAAIAREGDRVTTITWTGGRIGPDEFQEFPVSIGGVPESATELTFRAVQTYDDGTVVRWIETAVGDDEPEHPAPVLALTAAAPGGDEHHTATTVAVADEATDEDDDAEEGAPVAGAYAVAALGVLISLVAIMRTNRRPTTP